MSGSRSIWDQPRRRAKHHHAQFVDYLLVGMLLTVMTVIEVQFLCQVAGPDSVSLIQAADGIVTSDQIDAGNDGVVARL
ncbi:MAG TPA: hypothetical protein VKT26_00670 [Acetobacteraceae bacterium]|nr:hypothetical protein [Acetobacteraceae bacterium]